MGDKRANFDLAHLYEFGIGGVKYDPKQAVKILNEGYQAGYEGPLSYLASCYYRGVGVEQDFAKAAALFRELNDMSYFGSMYQGYLGLMMIQGLGVEKNVRAGLKMVRKVLKRNFGVGWACYGDCHRYGLGVKKDRKKAIYFYP